MRLHNRQIKATFWTDPDILQWPREKRWFYLGLVQLADDSGCIEDSVFAFKINLFPSPVDNDVTLDIISQWRHELVNEKKLEPYQVAGKDYLFISNFHKHQTLDKPTPPSKASIPLPPWIEWVQGDSRRKSHYIVRDKSGTCPGITGTGTITGTQTGTNNFCVPDSTSECSETSAENLFPGDEGAQSEADAETGKGTEYPGEFEMFWESYPRHKEKQAAFKCWLTRKKEGHLPRDMLIAAERYAAECDQLGTTQKFIKQAKTFLGPNKPFLDYLDDNLLQQERGKSNECQASTGNMGSIRRESAADERIALRTAQCQSVTRDSGT